MERLTGRTLRRAIEFAAEHENTSIGIIMDCLTSAVALRREILDEYRNLNRFAGDTILFSNGSRIKLFPLDGDQNVRGQRSNIVLVHSLATMLNMDSVFGRLESPWHGHQDYAVFYDSFTERYVEVRNGFAQCLQSKEEPQDFGEITPSLEILEYIGGASG